MDRIFGLNRSQLKSRIRERFTHLYPEDQSLLTNRVWSNIFSFVRGYITCFDYIRQTPINDNEVIDLLVEESLIFARKIIDNQKVH